MNGMGFCDAWKIALNEPAKFSGDISALIEHVDGCDKCRKETEASDVSEERIFELLAKASGSTDVVSIAGVDAYINELKYDTKAAISELVVLLEKQAARKRATDDMRKFIHISSLGGEAELRLWQAIEAEGSMIRQYGYQNKPTHIHMTKSGYVDLGRGERLSEASLAAEISMSVGFSEKEAHAIVKWIPHALFVVNKLFRGLDGFRQQEVIDLKVVKRDEELLSTRWFPEMRSRRHSPGSQTAKPTLLVSAG